MKIVETPDLGGKGFKIVNIVNFRFLVFNILVLSFSALRPRPEKKIFDVERAAF